MTRCLTSALDLVAAAGPVEGTEGAADALAPGAGPAGGLGAASPAGQPGSLVGLGRAVRAWQTLQDAVSELIDSASAPAPAGGRTVSPGIRQQLERKEGLFRSHLMGKRLNYACRSVVGPDVHLDPADIGLPAHFARKLSFPERVTDANVELMRALVVRGDSEYPGASAVEDERGRVVMLARLTREQRVRLAGTLLSAGEAAAAAAAVGAGEREDGGDDPASLDEGGGADGGGGAKGGASSGLLGVLHRSRANEPNGAAPVDRGRTRVVHRHVVDGDLLLTNRQPTLHRPGLLAHRARVLPGAANSKVIRMHYANCGSLNADFDGDEINLHLPQDHLARAEGHLLAAADHQLCVPTDGKPIRGLIQDHVLGLVLLTSRDCLLSRSEFSQLLWDACAPSDREGFGGIQGERAGGRLWGGESRRQGGDPPPGGEAAGGPRSKGGGAARGAGLRPTGGAGVAAPTPGAAWGCGEADSEAAPHAPGVRPRPGATQRPPAPPPPPLPIPAVFRGLPHPPPGAPVGHPARTPEPLWTGKQLISCLLGWVAAAEHRGPPGSAPAAVSLTHGCRTGAAFWDSGDPRRGKGGADHDSRVEVRRGELVTGAIDKAAFGRGGLLHGVQEASGDRAAGRLLAALSRLVTAWIRVRGFTCGFEDLLVVPEGEAERSVLLTEAQGLAVAASDGAAGREAGADPSAGLSAGARGAVAAAVLPARDPVAAMEAHARASLEPALRADPLGAGQRLDGAVCAALHPLSSKVVAASLPKRQRRPFLRNNLSLMTATGAKGSLVNHSQISCLLGQQELEGRRVPRTAFGKTLPSFRAFDAGARAGGFVGDRFLTGLRPQEYYFHCMAGRDGLVDTAVKTARSGYLQRCLVKSLESLVSAYDSTVRDQADGGIASFRYGGDGADPVRGGFLAAGGGGGGKGGDATQLDFVARNAEGLARGLAGWGGGKGCPCPEPVPGGEEAAEEEAWAARRASRAAAEGAATADDNSAAHLPPDAAVDGPLGARARRVGVVLSERVRDAVEAFLSTEASEDALRLGGLLSDDSDDEGGGKSVDRNRDARRASRRARSQRRFLRLVSLRAQQAAVAPGEAVGVVAAQSLGEPSTQMTLNTFHMAGRGEANVTLGIPRLRELLMTGASDAKTPTMTLPVVGGDPDRTRAAADRLAARLGRLGLAAALESLSVIERPVGGGGGKGWKGGESVALASAGRCYDVVLRLVPPHRQPLGRELTGREARACVEGDFSPRLRDEVRKALRRAARGGASSGAGLAVGVVGGGPVGSGGKGAEAAVDSGRAGDDDDAPADHDGAAATVAATAGEELGDDDEGSAPDSDEDEDSAGAEERAGRGGGQDAASDDAADLDAARRTPAKAKRAKRPAAVAANDDDVDDPDVWKDEWTVRVTLPGGAPKLLLLELAEACAARAALRGVPGVDGARVLPPSKGAKPSDPVLVQTDGCNLGAAWELACLMSAEADAVDAEAAAAAAAAARGKSGKKIKKGVPGPPPAQPTWPRIDASALVTNDVGVVLRTYGVEAARSCLIREIRSVFGAYGISVDPRHLDLVGDWATRLGGHRPASRLGVAPSPAPLLKASFETAAKFVVEAATSGGRDDLAVASGAVCLGRPARLGAGCVDLLCELS